MAAISRILAAWALVLAGGAAASAYDGYVVYWQTPASAYYYPAAPVYSYYYWPGPTYYSCAPSAVRVVPVDGFYAQPFPAPPSPPVDKKVMPSAQAENDKRGRPSILATRVLPGSFSPGAKPLAKDHCRVGFWNMTGREVKLTIEGQTWTVQKDRSLTLDLTRSFAWQIDSRGTQEERIPDGQLAQELFIRD